jgi:hypothetical protein
LLELVVLAIEAGSEGHSAGVSPILLGDQARFKTKDQVQGQVQDQGGRKGEDRERRGEGED